MTEMMEWANKSFNIALTKSSKVLKENMSIMIRDKLHMEMIQGKVYSLKNTEVKMKNSLNGLNNW